MAMPLEGVRILDLSQVLGGPLATRILGDLGAEIIKIEQPGSGDASRRLGPYFLNGESAYFLAFNRNKKSITLNLQKPEGKAIFQRLVPLADMVLDNFRPSVLPKLGIDYETIAKLNPRIISCSLSGFGQEGPYRDRPAFDGVVQAMGGAMSVTGEPGGPPLYMGFPIGDAGGGFVEAMGALAALYARERTGKGQRVDVSMLDVQIALQGHLGQFYLASGEVPQPIGAGHPANVPVGAFKTKDGTYVQVHCTTQPFYEKTAKLMAAEVEGLDWLPEDARFTTPSGRMKHRKELETLLRDAFTTKTTEEWSRLFVEWDIPAAPINNIAQALVDPQVQFRNMVVDVDHPTVGSFKTIGNPIKMGQEERFEPPPTLGQHTREVLHDLLGCTDVELDALAADGVI